MAKGHFSIITPPLVKVQPPQRLQDLSAELAVLGQRLLA